MDEEVTIHRPLFFRIMFPFNKHDHNRSLVQSLAIYLISKWVFKIRLFFDCHTQKYDRVQFTLTSFALLFTFMVQIKEATHFLLLCLPQQHT